MSRPSLRHTVLAGVAAFVAAGTLGAQGAISLQGFGYPPGQTTTRAAGTGGALTEFDHAAPQNPAALLAWGVAGAYMQYTPERRSVSVDGTSRSNTVARFPLFAVGLPVGQKYTFGISSSTMLERNFTATTTARQFIRSDSVTTTTAANARGGMNAVQFAGGMQVNKWVRVGTAVQIVTGENRVTTTRTLAPDRGSVLADTVRFTEASTATFSGAGLSLGVEITPIRTLSFAMSARRGFGLRAELNDSVSRRADVPSRVGAAMRWEVGGTNLAARYNWEGWSAMRGLGTDVGGTFDTHEYGAGAELPGPKLRGGQLILRLGARRRDLPFGLGGVQPRETSFGGGVGLPVAFGRAQVDLGVERASRTLPGVSNLSERGLLFSFGFRLRT